MENIDRALLVRDMLIRDPDGRFAADGVKVITSLAHTARIQTPFNPLQASIKSRRRSKSDQAFHDCSAPYKFELILFGGKSVLQLSWELDDQNLHLYRYREGAWENAFFGLPYRGKPAAKSWERKLPSPEYLSDLVPADHKGRQPWYFSGTEW